ncbi:hypothetical protein D3C87_1426550 [compost metagenome]
MPRGISLELFIDDDGEVEAVLVLLPPVHQVRYRLECGLYRIGGGGNLLRCCLLLQPLELAGNGRDGLAKIRVVLRQLRQLFLVDVVRVNVGVDPMLLHQRLQLVPFGLGLLRCGQLLTQYLDLIARLLQHFIRDGVLTALGQDHLLRLRGPFTALLGVGLFVTGCHLTRRRRGVYVRLLGSSAIIQLGIGLTLDRLQHGFQFVQALSAGQVVDVRIHGCPRGFSVGGIAAQAGEGSR